MREPIRLRGVHFFVGGILVGAALVAAVLVVQRLRRDDRDRAGDALALICGEMRHDHEVAWKELSKPEAKEVFPQLFAQRPYLLYPLMQVFGDANYVSWCGATPSTSPDFTSIVGMRKYVHEVLTSMPHDDDGHDPDASREGQHR